MKLSEAARFLEGVHVDESTGCWNWNPFKGTFPVLDDPNEPHVSPQRLAYKHEHGVWAVQLDIHPLCENINCVNPEHLVAYPR